jgi:hypothetical protein
MEHLSHIKLIGFTLVELSMIAVILFSFTKLFI